MLGSGIIKYLIIGGVLILFGSVLLNSIVSIVSAVQQGSYIPLTWVTNLVIITLSFLGKHSRMALKVLSRTNTLRLLVNRDVRVFQ